MYVYCVNAYNSADHMSFPRIPNGFNPYVYVYLLTVFLKYSKASFELMSVAMYLVKCLPILHSYVSLASHACLIIFQKFIAYILISPWRCT